MPEWEIELSNGSYWVCRAPSAGIAGDRFQRRFPELLIVAVYKRVEPPNSAVPWEIVA